MPSTYMDLTNRLLRRLNEVELTSSNFASAKGIHAAARDAVLDTVRKINNSKYKWPFNSTSGTQVLTVGQELYDWPASFKSVEWDSFQILRDTNLGVNHKHLGVINREEWYANRRDVDMDATTTGVTVPDYVFLAQNNKWGVTPSPDQAYTVAFSYWTQPDDLDAYDDEVTIPSEFDYVITAGGLYHMYLFSDNDSRTQLAWQAYEDGMSNMINRYFGENHHHVFTEMVNT